MSWEELKAKVGDDAKLVSFIDTQVINGTNNVEKINSLEKTNGDLLGEVKNFKQGNTLVKSVLGIDQLNADTLKEALGNRKGGDEALQNELNNWKQKHETLVNENTTKEDGYKNQLKDMALTNSLRDLGIDALASSPISSKILLDELKKGATLDGDKIVYKKEDGTTEFVGSDVMTPNVKLESMKTNKDYSPFFKPDILSGGDSKPNSSNADNAKQTMNSTEMMKAGRK